jgi:hypothetical protein
VGFELKSASVTPAKPALPPPRTDAEQPVAASPPVDAKSPPPGAASQSDAAAVAPAHVEQPSAKRQRISAGGVAAWGSEGSEPVAGGSVLEQGPADGEGVPSVTAPALGPRPTEAAAAGTDAVPAAAQEAASVPAESVRSTPPASAPAQAEPAAQVVAAVQPQRQLVVMPPTAELPLTAAQGTAAIVVAQQTGTASISGATPANDAGQLTDAAPEPLPIDLQTGEYGPRSCMLAALSHVTNSILRNRWRVACGAAVNFRCQCIAFGLASGHRQLRMSLCRPVSSIAQPIHLEARC